MLTKIQTNNETWLTCGWSVFDQGASKQYNMNTGTVRGCIQEYLKRTVICSIRFSIDAYSKIEKVFWIVVCILGSILGIYIINNQILSWQDNPIVSSSISIPLHQVDVPAVTLCHRGSSKFAIAKRFGNAVKNSDKLAKFRKVLIRKVALENLHLPVDHFSEIESVCTKYPNKDFCTGITGIKHYSRIRNLTLNKILNDAYDKIENCERKMPHLQNVLTNETLPWTILDTELNDLVHLEAFRKLFIVDQKFYCPKDFGTFYVSAFTDTVMLQKVLDQNLTDEFYDTFMYPNTNISLITLAHLYTMNNFGQLTEPLFSYDYQKPYLKVPQDFQKCFLDMEYKYYQNTLEDTDEDTEQEILYTPAFNEMSPCPKITQNHSCYSYCKWHEKFVLQDLPKLEFLTLMRLALPQGKIYMGNLTATEKSMIKKIFNEIGNLENPTSPNPFVIFCKNRRDQKWIGSEIAKYCGDFYPSPTDVGLCMTQNQG